MNILMILADRDFPPDIRVEKEIRTLKNASHNVAVLCSSAGNRSTVETWKGINILRVTKPAWEKRKLNTFTRMVNFIDRYWVSIIHQTVKSHASQVLHVHDLPMLGTALRVGREDKLPVIADLHENYPAALRYYSRNDSMMANFKRHLLFNPDRWQKYESRSVKQADHILVVIDEAKERLVDAGISARKITLIENYVDIDSFESFSLDHKLINQYQGKFILSYIGGFGGSHRGLDTVINAMPGVLRHIPEAHLLLVGDGSIKPLLQKLVTEQNLQNKVEFVPWQPINMVPSYIALSDVCLVPHHTNPHTEATNPHKLFQYMLMGKPVVVSTCKPLRRIVQEANCGVVFEAGNPHSFAAAVSLLKNPVVRKRLGKSGQKSVYEKYNWKRTSEKLIEVYRNISSYLSNLS